MGFVFFEFGYQKEKHLKQSSRDGVTCLLGAVMGVPRYFYTKTNSHLTSRDKSVYSHRSIPALIGVKINFSFQTTKFEFEFNEHLPTG
jgi:hypothetical protein